MTALSVYFPSSPTSTASLGAEDFGWARQRHNCSGYPRAENKHVVNHWEFRVVYSIELSQTTWLIQYINYGVYIGLNTI